MARPWTLALALCGVAACREDNPAFVEPSSDVTGQETSAADEESTGTPQTSCGNGVLDPGEACDDGNTDDTDDCVAGCVPATCGDGFVWAGVEACDGLDVGGNTCDDLGGAGGGLACTATCEVDASACACGTSAVPVGGECPASCTGGCTATACTIDCSNNGSCSGDALVCPPGWDCTVLCTGNDSCGDATIACSDWACQVSCAGNNGCAGAAVTCGSGVCDVSC